MRLNRAVKIVILDFIIQESRSRSNIQKINRKDTYEWILIRIRDHISRDYLL